MKVISYDMDKELDTDDYSFEYLDELIDKIAVKTLKDINIEMSPSSLNILYSPDYIKLSREYYSIAEDESIQLDIYFNVQ